MKKDITNALIEEHKLILRMLDLLQHNAEMTARREFKEYQFFLDAVDFIREYADSFHHAKEEDILFAALVKGGMPRENSPVAAMLMEHDQGRAYVKALESAVKRSLAGEEGLDQVIAENASGYISLLREHIEKEDSILYPLAERLIGADEREVIVQSYADAEAKWPTDPATKYLKLLEKYEAEAQRRAA